MSEFIIEEAPKDLAEDFAEFFEGSADKFIAGGLLRNYFEWTNNNKKDKPAEALLLPGVSSESPVLNQLGNKSVRPPMLYLGKDVDVFFKDETSFNNFTKGSSTHFVKTYDTPNSVGFEAFYSPRVLTLDCVRKNYGTPEEVLKGFDQVASQAALFKSDGTDGLVKDKIYIMSHPRFRESVDEGRMLLNHTRNNHNYHIIERTVRYINYGYLPDEETSREIIDIFLNNHAVLTSFTAEDFMQEFGKKRLKNLLLRKSDQSFNDIYEEDLKERMIDESVGEYANALYCFLGSNSSTFYASSGPSMASNSTVERNYVRTAKNYIGDKVLNNSFTRRKAYEKTVMDLNLPATLKERLNVTHDIVRFHQFLAEKREIIGEDMVEFFVDFVHSRFVTRSAEDSSRSVIHCAVYDNHELENPVLVPQPVQTSSDGSLWFSDGKEPEVFDDVMVEVIDYEKMEMSDIRRHMNKYEEKYHSSDDWVEIIHESFLKNPDDDEWLKKTAAFYKEALTFCGEELPVNQVWHDMLDSDGFDPNIPPFLLLELYA